MKKISIITIIGAGIIAAGLYFLFKKPKASTTTKDTKPAIIPGATQTTETQPAAIPAGSVALTGPQAVQILKKGSRGDLVKVLQVHLNQNRSFYRTALTIDGIFGEMTEQELARQLDGEISINLYTLNIIGYNTTTFKPVYKMEGIFA